jgi:hypothetical protein
MDALALAALKGAVQREEILASFGGLFTGTEADRSSDLFWSNLASAATESVAQGDPAGDQEGLLTTA